MLMDVVVLMRLAEGTNFGSAVGFDALHALQRLNFTRAVDGSGSLLNYIAMLIEEEEEEQRQQEEDITTSASASSSGGGGETADADGARALSLVSKRRKVSLMTSLRRLEEAMARASRTPITQIEGDLNLLQKKCKLVKHVVDSVKREINMRNKRREMVRTKRAAANEAVAQGKKLTRAQQPKPGEDALVAERDLDPEDDPFVIRMGAFHQAAVDTLALLQSELGTTVRLFTMVRVAMGVGEYATTDDEANLRTGGGGGSSAAGGGGALLAASQKVRAEEAAKAPKPLMRPETLFTQMGTVLRALRSAVEENRARKLRAELQAQQNAQKLIVQRKRRETRAKTRDRRMLETLASAPASLSKRAEQYNNPLPNSHWMQLMARRQSAGTGGERPVARFGAATSARARARASELDEDADDDGGDGVSEMKRMVEARRQRAKEGRPRETVVQQSGPQSADVRAGSGASDSASDSVYNQVQSSSAPQTLAGFDSFLAGAKLRMVERKEEPPQGQSGGSEGPHATASSDDADTAIAAATAALTTADNAHDNATAVAVTTTATAAATAVATAAAVNEEHFHVLGDLRIGYSVGDAWERVRAEWSPTNWLLLRCVVERGWMVECGLRAEFCASLCILVHSSRYIHRAFIVHGCVLPCLL
jgi:hypothetical protein